jgi:hypothetical protein
VLDDKNTIIADNSMFIDLTEANKAHEKQQNKEHFRKCKRKQMIKS